MKQISIDFQLLQTDISHDAKLVVDLSGVNIKNQWQDFLIKNLSTTVQKWNEVHYVYSLPENFYKGDVIKIYVYNPTGSIIFIDDVRIKYIK